MKYMKKHLKWMIIFIILLLMLVFVMIFGTKEEPIVEKETTSEITSKNEQEIETTNSNGISIEEKDPYGDDGWSDIVYFD